MIDDAGGLYSLYSSDYIPIIYYIPTICPLCVPFRVPQLNIFQCSTRSFFFLLQVTRDIMLQRLVTEARLGI